MDLTTLAQRKILPATLSDALLKKDYDTADIMNAVFSCYEKYWKDVQSFATALRGETLYETCSNVWHFVKNNISYVKDPAQNQWVRSPKRLWADKQGDCKSYSVFIASCLRSMNIPHIFRFVSFEQTDVTPTHVYIVVMQGSKEIILDCVTNAFDKQAPFTFKFDYMKGLYVMNGLPGVHGGAGTLLYGSKRREALAAVLPQLAINFVYSFIPHGGFWNQNKTDMLSRLPQAVKDKENKAWTVANDWSDWAGWNENELMQTIRGHITNVLGVDPEIWWAQILKGNYGIAGIWGTDAAAASNTTANTTNSTTQGSNTGATIKFTAGLISSLFNNNGTIPFKVPLEQFTPMESDWTGIYNASLNPVAIIKTKATLGYNPAPVANNTTAPVNNNIPVLLPSTQTPVYNNTGTAFDPNTGLFKDAAGNYYNSNGAVVDPATGAPLNSPVSNAASLGNSNMLLTVGLLGAAAFFLFKGKK